MTPRRLGARQWAEAAPTLPVVVARAFELVSGESPASRTFIGGLVAGALFGAALAGAAVLRSRAADRPGTPIAPPRRG